MARYFHEEAVGLAARDTYTEKMALQPTPEEIQHMMENVDDTLKPNILACEIICLITGLTATGLRIWGRRLTTARLDLSDWLAMVALVSSTGPMQECPTGR